MNKEIAMMVIAQKIYNSNEVEIRYDRDGQLVATVTVSGTPEEILKKENLLTQIQIGLGAHICITVHFKE